jgi:PAS domain S-box-containing protein
MSDNETRPGSQSKGSPTFGKTRRPRGVDFHSGNPYIRDLLDTIPDVVVLYGPDLRIRYINPAATAITGIEPRQFIGKTDEELFPGSDHQPVLDLLKKTQETGQFQSLVTWLKLPGQEHPHYLRISCTPLLNDDGEVFELIGITQDLTERAQIGQKLRENHRLSEIAGNIARLGGWRVNVGSDTVLWSEQAARIHGLPPEFQPTVDLAIEYYVPEHRDLIRSVFSDCIKDGIPFDEELEILNRDGQRVWIRTTGEAVRDSDGNIIAAQGALQDISERRRAEDRLLASEERFRLVSRVTSDVIWDLDCGNDRVWWSEGLQTIFGHHLNKSDTGLAWWLDHVHPDDRESIIVGFKAALDGEVGKWSGEYRFRRADDSYARVSDMALVMRDDDGRPTRVIGSIRDMTRELAMEEQVAQAQRLESIGHLTGGIAHDFNNLLTVILGNAELLTEMLEDYPAALTLAEMVQSAARRGSDLTNRLLAFARRQALDPGPTDIVGLVDDMQPLLRRSISADINLEIRHAEGLWKAQIDAVQLESALLNLVINARDAMPDGGYLHIATENVTLTRDDVNSVTDLAPGDYVQITVADTGSGIKPEHLDMLFEPFFSTKPKGKGTGLGLAMVWGFIKQSQGHVQVESEPSQGTTVRMFLPRREGTGSVVRPASVEQLNPSECARVLVVEDNELVLLHARRLLESMGHHVVCAENGDVAVELLQANPDFDLIFTDIIMPGSFNGPALARKARQLIPGIAVLFTSGYTEDAVSRDDLVNLGAGLLHKPYRKQDLADKIHEALRERQT